MTVLNNDIAFPNDPIFTRLRQVSTERPGIFFHDENGIDAGYGHLINDVVHMRRVLRDQLSSASFNEKGFLHKETACIAFLSLNGYYFVVSFLAIAALGGICIPLPINLKEEETFYLLSKTRATCILTDADNFDQAVTMRDFVQNQAVQKLSVISITRAEDSASTSCLKLEIDEELTISPATGCLVLFTSGTTGLPKGIVLPRRTLYYTEELADPAVLYLASSPPHWIGGAMGPLMSVLNGEKLHTLWRESTPAKFWEILKEGKVTDLSLSPTFVRKLMEYYNENIRDLPSVDRDRYLNGARKLKIVYTSGSVLNPSVRKFFKDLINMPIANGYGITEMGGGVMVTPAGSDFLDGCIGKPFPGITVKLSENDHGEILVKSPSMFIGYINDEAATRAAFDHEGFYRSGDHAHLVGDSYFYDGRISSDWVRFHEYTISVLELEQHLTDLPYISEAYILPVKDHESGGLAAALVRLRKQYTPGESGNISITLQRIREDLAANGMVSYKLPTLLRILQNDEEVPRTASDKAKKKECLQKYFNITEYLPNQYSVDGVEYWGNKLDSTTLTRLFDWGGL